MNQKLADSNNNYCMDTIRLKQDIETNYMELAHRLCTIEDEKKYEPNYETFDDFLEDLKMDRTKAYRLKTLWRRFVIEFKIKPVQIAEAGGWVKVTEVMNYARNKSEAEEWLGKVKIHTRSDLRKEIIEAKTGIDMMHCSHKKVERITFERCTTCGDSWRINEEKK